MASGPEVCGRGSEFIAAEGEIRFVKTAEGEGAVVLLLLLLLAPTETGVAGPPPLPCGALAAFPLEEAPAPLPEVGRTLGDEPVAPPS